MRYPDRNIRIFFPAPCTLQLAPCILHLEFCSEPGLHQYFVIMLELADPVPDIFVILNLVYPVAKHAGRLIDPS